MRRTTITDVARLAGVSPATVSRALRGGTNVTPATAERVRRAADELSFTLSKNASALATGRTMRVRLLVSGTLKAWFNASVLQGAYDVLTPAGYDVIPSFILDRAELDRFFAHLPSDRNMDGLIVASFHFSQTLHDSLHGIPVVGVNSPSTDGFDASVSASNDTGIREAIGLLRSLGHRSIAFAGATPGSDRFFSTQMRSMCFPAAARDLGYDEDHQETIVMDPGTTATDNTFLAHAIAGRLLASPRHPTGLCVETDELAIPLLSELRRQGIRVPEDMSVIGFDDAPVAHAAGLTTIHQDPEDLGRRAALMLLPLLSSGTPLSSGTLLSSGTQDDPNSRYDQQDNRNDAEERHQTLDPTVTLRRTTSKAPRE